MKVAAIDIETTGLNPRYDKIHSIAVVTSSSETVLDTSQYTIEEMRGYMARLRDEYDVVIAHNAKFDASFIYTNYGVLFKNLYCTMLGSQIIKNGKDTLEESEAYTLGHSLIACLKEYLNIDDIQTNHKKLMRQRYLDHRLGAPITKEMADYVLYDTKYLIRLWEEQMIRIRILGMEKVIKLENALIPVLIKMETGGCLVDRERWEFFIAGHAAKLEEVEEKLDAELLRLSQTIPELQGGIYTRPRIKQKFLQTDLFGNTEIIENSNSGNINYSSAAQIIELIDRVDGVKLEAVGIDDLHTYMNEHQSKLAHFLEILLEHREYDKVVSTYGKKLLEKLDENNYIHTEYTQCRTKTGRLASKNPNLQNIPNGTIREFFIASPENDMITCDMSGAEVSLAADFSGEPLLLDAILHGADMHSKLASVTFSIIFGKPITITNTDEPIVVGDKSYPASKLRKVHKSVTFAKFYKAGANRIYQTLAEYINEFHPPDNRLSIARKISTALDKEMPHLTSYLSKKIKEAQNQGFLQGVLGRVRFFSEDVYGEAANFPIQNANAEAMKMALVLIDNHLESVNYGRLVLNIHDEVVVECPTAHSQALGNTIQELMAWSLGYFLKTIKGGASININRHWEK